MLKAVSLQLTVPRQLSESLKLSESSRLHSWKKACNDATFL